MSEKFTECNKDELAVAIAAAEAVAKLVDAMLNSNAEEYPDFIRDLKAAYRVGALGYRVILDFRNENLAALGLYSLSDTGAAKRISKVQFKSSPTANEVVH